MLLIEVPGVDLHEHEDVEDHRVVLVRAPWFRVQGFGFRVES